MNEQEPKRSFWDGKNCFVFILWSLTAIFFIIIGAFVYYLVDTYILSKIQKPEESETKDTSISEGYDGWQTYESEEYKFSFKYPKDWNLEDRLICEGDNCGYIKVTNGTYIWTLWLDPIYTGGGYGYLFDIILPPSSVEYSKVKIGDFECMIITNYVSNSDYDKFYPDSDIDYNFGENAWGGSVIFEKDTDSKSIEEQFSTPGFGSGEANDDIKGDYFSIIYSYNSQKEDYSDLPHKEDEDFKNMLIMLNKISNSFIFTEGLGEDTLDDQTGYEGWSVYNNSLYGYSVKYPSAWEVNELAQHDCSTVEGDSDCINVEQKGDYIEIGHVGKESTFVIQVDNKADTSKALTCMTYSSDIDECDIDSVKLYLFKNTDGAFADAGWKYDERETPDGITICPYLFFQVNENIFKIGAHLMVGTKVEDYETIVKIITSIKF